MTPPYCGRFAPSPSGPLHAGSLVAALASWLDARAHDGKWLIRMENLDPPRERPGAAAGQIATLARLGLHSDEPIMFQSDRDVAYRSALDELQRQGRLYRCTCPRRALGDSAGPYPGTCRTRGLALDGPGAIRFRVTPGTLAFVDRAVGHQQEDVSKQIGDFIVRRSDGLWAYQLAVVVDDAAQGVTDIVRGADLLDNTARQRQLQQALGLAHPRTLHVPLVRDGAGRKLSKHEGAAPLDQDPLAALAQAWQHLGFEALDLPGPAAGAPDFLRAALPHWTARWGMHGFGDPHKRCNDAPANMKVEAQP